MCFILYCYIVYVLTSVSDPRHDISRWFSLQASSPGSVMETWMSSKALSLTALEETWIVLSLDLMVWEDLHMCWQFLFTYLKSGSLHLSIHPSIHPSHAPVGSDSLRPQGLSLPGSSVRWFSRQEYWSEYPFPHPGDLPDPGIKLMSPALQMDSLPLEPLRKQFP